MIILFETNFCWEMVYLHLDSWGERNVIVTVME